MQQRYGHLKESLHKEVRGVWGDEIQVREKQRKIGADLGKLVIEKKKLYLKSKTTKLQEDNNAYSILKRKVKVEIWKAGNWKRGNKCSEFENVTGYAQSSKA